MDFLDSFFSQVLNGIRWGLLWGCLLAMLVVLTGCANDPISNEGVETFTIYSQYIGHNTKGRGVAVWGDDRKTVIITARHVINEFFPNEKILVKNNYFSGDPIEAQIETIYQCSDMALIYIPTKVPYLAKIRQARVGDSVRAFNYDDDTLFDDFHIYSADWVSGKVTGDAAMTNGMWEAPIFVMEASYPNRNGMSGEGIFNDAGELIGIHSGANGAQKSIFTPILRAQEMEQAGCIDKN